MFIILQKKVVVGVRAVNLRLSSLLALACQLDFTQRSLASKLKLSFINMAAAELVHTVRYKL